VHASDTVAARLADLLLTVGEGPGLAVAVASRIVDRGLLLDTEG
jgi:hypothetical protein